MKIAIGCDHAAYNEKKNLIRFIESELGFKVIDVGTNSEDSVDYAEYGHMVGGMEELQSSPLKTLWITSSVA